MPTYPPHSWKDPRQISPPSPPSMDPEIPLASDAWHHAIEKHMASLTRPQREELKVPASPEDCMRLIGSAQSRHARRGSAVKVLEALRPLLEPLKRFQCVIDVLVQTNGGIGSPIWGPLRFAIMVAIDHLRTLEKLAIMLQRIVASLARVTNYEVLFRTNLHMQKAIAALYGDLLDLCTRVVHFYSRPFIRAMFVSFDKEFQQVSENIAFHSSEVELAANAANIVESKVARHVEETSRQVQLRTSVQKWLSPANVLDDLYRNERTCMTGSCDWAFKTPQLGHFLDSKGLDILRIGGAPGCGKSTLAATIIRHLMDTKKAVVLYFFCKNTEEKWQKPYQVLRTLISQLLIQDDLLYPLFERLYEQSGHKTAESLASLEDSLRLALNNTSYSLTYIVVDGLDECQQSSVLSTYLVELSSPAVKVLLTSRNDPELLKSFTQPLEELIIQPTHVQDPVWNYVGHRVSHCRQISGTDFGSVVHSRVAVAAGGSWLYARLMMDEIQRLPSEACVRNQLKNIPDGLVQLYQQIFTSMSKTLTPLELRLAQQVFLWVDLSDFMPAGRTYLDNDIIEIVFQAENDGNPVFDPVELVRRLCSPLVGVYEMGDGYVEFDLVHHTAAQFIKRCSTGREDFEVPAVLRPQVLKGLYRANISAWFFEESPKSTSSLEEIRTQLFPGYGEYYEMAYGLWDAFFLEYLPPLLNEEELAIACRLCDRMTRFLQSTKCLKWVEMAITVNYTWGYVKLFSNVMQALNAAESGTRSAIPAFRAFSVARREFFGDYAYVISRTGPAGESEQTLESPEGFEDREMAKNLLGIGEQWGYLYQRYKDTS